MIEAMKMYRNAGEGTVADALHKEALVLQQIARREAQSFSVEMDFAGYVDEARAKVGGQDLNSALTTLASIATPPRLSWLRRQTEEEIQAFPFQHWIQEALKDDRGRTIARRATRGNDESSDQRAFRVDMLKNAEFMRGGMVLAHIEPARVQIMLEHQPRIDQFVDLVSVSPFVPNDRVMIFARGLLGGLKGDFLLAIHLLVPQLEHSIRRIFEQHGVLTTALRQEDVQEDRSLGSLLLDDRFQEAGNDIFGEDLYFDLRGVLVERWGANLRNRVAHGLMSDSAFSSVQCCYAWWMTLRLVLWPHLIALQQEPGEPDMFADPESEASDDFDLD